MAKDFVYPQFGALRAHFEPGDFLDGQSVPLPHPAPDAIDLTIATFFAMPGWIKFMVRLRDSIVGPLGLKTGTPGDLTPPTRDELINGTYSGIFSVHSANPDEVILGTNDRHLDFRLSIMRSLDTDLVAISTWVHPHNLAGRLYLAVVYPFHRVIVARCLANAAQLGIQVVPA